MIHLSVVRRAPCATRNRHYRCQRLVKTTYESLRQVERLPESLRSDDLSVHAGCSFPRWCDQPGDAGDHRCCAAIKGSSQPPRCSTVSTLIVPTCTACRPSWVFRPTSRRITSHAGNLGPGVFHDNHGGHRVKRRRGAPSAQCVGRSFRRKRRAAARRQRDQQAEVAGTRPP